MFYGFVITEGGNRLLAKMVAGQRLELTRVVMERGTADNAETARLLTAPIDPGPEGTSTTPTLDANTVNMIVEYRSDLGGGLQEGFWIGGFAIYAKDPDGGADVMIYYGSLGDAKQYVSAYTAGTAPDVRRYPVSVTVTAGVEVSATYPVEAWMTAQDVADYFNGTLRPELEASLSRLIEAHNTDDNAHGGLRKLIEDGMDAALTAAGEAKDTADTALTAAGEANVAAASAMTAAEEAATAATNAEKKAAAAKEAVEKLAHTIGTVPFQIGALTFTGAEQSPAWNGYNPGTMTMGGATRGTNAGTYTATFTPLEGYTWSDSTAGARSVTWTIGRADITTVPAQSGTLTYTGATRSPAWSNYDTAKMTIGGATSGINAGTYTAAFMPTGNYKWSDGNTGAKLVNWAIGKAAGSMTIDKAALALANGLTIGTIAVTRAGDGVISAVSSDTSVATAIVSGTVVTVTGMAYGTATITISVAAGTNHNAPADKTCSVSVKLYNTTLNNNSWSMIREASDGGQAANIWSVGDTKTITINGKVGQTTFSNLSVDAFIIGINHNSGREGSNRIHFQIGKVGGTHVALVDAKYNSPVTTTGYFSMNATNVNTGGWKSSQMRNTVLGNNGTPSSPTANTLLAAMPSDLRAVMKSCTKYSDNTGNGIGTANDVTNTTDHLFLLSEFEYHGVRSYANITEIAYQAQYNYYKAGNSKVHYRHDATGTAALVFCRSVTASYSNTFCLVSTDGTASATNAHYSYGVAPGFCV